MSEEINIPNNLEIDKALKEFEAKNTEQNQKAPEASKAPEIPPAPNNPVEGVIFETDSYKAVKYYDETATPKVIKLVMKISGGTIKEERQAEYVLLGFTIVVILLSVFMFYNSSNTNKAE